jgi:uncharacterized OsmC-like protein
MSLRELQQPLKERYRQEPEAAKIRLTVESDSAVLDDPMRSRVGTEVASFETGAHPGVGGTGDVACSGDVLLAALAACQEITLKMVAANMGIELEDVKVTVTGDLDLRGTLGMDREVDVGFERIRCDVRVKTTSDPERARRFFERAEQFCVVLNTLRKPLAVESSFAVER